jgi:glycerol-1-phosphate dehydrogenase [NAD(P)+]
MQLSASSRPASGSEHRFSHLWEMQALVRAWPSRADLEREVRAAHDSPQLADNAVSETLAKYVDADGLRRRLERLQTVWPDVRSRIEAQLMPAERLRDLLRAAGCPTHPGEIGLDAAQFRASYGLARTIRSRYTVLDLVHETGILDACVSETFGPGGYWAGERGRALGGRGG